MSASPPTIRVCALLGCDLPVTAKRKDALYCSDKHRKAAQRLPPPGRIPDPHEVAQKLMAQHGVAPTSPSLRWEEVNESVHKLTDGKVDMAEPPMGFAHTHAVAFAQDRGTNPDRAVWCAVHKSLVIGPAWMEMAGLTPGLETARMVAEAMVTGDVRPLVLAAHQHEDGTEDMRLTLLGMLQLLVEPVDDDDEPTELPDFETEKMMVARLNRDWCVVRGDDAWVLQHRLDGDDWEWAGRFKHKRTLIHAIDQLVVEVDTGAIEVIEDLPEKPGTPG